MAELLVPPLAGDTRGRAFDALSARSAGFDLSPALIYLIDQAPAELLPLLAEQFNVVGPLWAYLPDDAAKRRAIKESAAWHRAKGSPWSVEAALSWAGYAARVEDATAPATRWAEFQLELDAPVDGDALQTVLELARFAAPARSHLARLYGGYDRRVLNASSGDRWSDAFLSDDSGVWRDGVQLSFGRRRPLSAACPAAATGLGRRRVHASRTLYPDMLRYGTAHFGDAPVLNHPVMRSRLIGLGNKEGLRDPVILAGNPPSPSWTGGWDERTWGRWLPMTPHRRTARAALVLSGDTRLGEPNTRFGGWAETSAGRFIWSDSACRLSDFNPGRTRLVIEAVEVAAHGLAAVRPDDGDAMGARTVRYSLHGEKTDWRGAIRMDGGLRWSDRPLAESTGWRLEYRLNTGSTAGLGPRADRYGWRGRWDDRRWRGDLSLTHQTLTT
ncbi:phage tail protein [Chromobacterium vaccinii]|uniref:Phage tail protein n=1 Tax=Chromobacterium vaccinii TaxID=1108595 RepID=A0ABV0FE60_9NEIS